MTLRSTLFSLGLIFSSALAISNELKDATWVALPAVGSSPETGFQYGAYVMRIFEQRTLNAPQDRVELLIQGSTKDQFQAFVWPNLYFQDGKFQLVSALGAKYWPNTYFGQGNETAPDGDKYSDTAIEASSKLFVKVAPQLSVGIGFQSEFHTIEDIEEEPAASIFSPAVTGFEGGKYIGAGLSAIWDTRNSLDWPTSGNLVRIDVDIFDESLSSDLSFVTFNAKGAKFLNIEDDVVALSASYQFTSHDTPFSHLAKASGTNSLRGANGQRWINNQGVGTQTEYRKTLSHKWAAVAFLDTFQVANDVSELSIEQFHYSVGAGVRFAMTPDRFNIRFDLGWVDAESFNFALSVSEAF